MTKNYLNVGCGSHFIISKGWTNLDFVSTSEHVIPHNLLQGIPFPDKSFDLVYHSHVLEHFSKDDGRKLIEECFRVLKPGGLIRIAIPNLEEIAKNYLKFLELSYQNKKNSLYQANYDWSLIEMFDQTVRNHTGGAMLAYLAQDKIENEEFVMSRIGLEGSELRAQLSQNKPMVQPAKSGFLQKVKRKVKKGLSFFFVFGPKELSEFERIGRFRLGGEVHQWMYDRFSIQRLLEDSKFTDVEIKDAFSSYNESWEEFGLDGIKPIVRKPDSLFVEAIKH